VNPSQLEDWRRVLESNQLSQLCRPVHCHFATPPFEFSVRLKLGGGMGENQTSAIMFHDGFSDTPMTTLLGISGSLRKSSLNSALLRTAQALAPAGMRIEICTLPGELPLFNPDLEAEMPPVVVKFRQAVNAADALLIASPEYAHGVTGVMKNALDWLVSDPLFVDKKVAVLNAAPRANHADEALREILRTMSAVIVEEASLPIPGIRKHFTDADMAQSLATVSALKTILSAL
jgi:chromate reductase